jgi:type IX secretion system PorP/SprF family membrane protein
MKKFYITLLASAMLLGVSAQDIHYTQFYNTPLTTNPALTGVFNGAYRIGAIYRNQWFSAVNNTGFFNSPFQTPSISFDMPIFLKNGDAIGVGALILYDEAGAGSISTFTGQISGSYIKHLGANGRHQLSAGFQVGFTQYKLSAADQRFASQYSGNDFNPNISSGVGLIPNVNYVNLNVGLLYFGKLTNTISLYAGGTIFNTTVPKVNLVSSQNNEKLSLRGNISGGMDFTLGRRYHILPSAMWQRQDGTSDLNTGVGFGYDINMRTNITLGVYNRANNVLDAYHQSDAAIIYAAFQVKGAKLGVSYDFTTSKFRDSNNAGTGGLEISFIYIGLAKMYDERKMMFCPRF